MALGDEFDWRTPGTVEAPITGPITIHSCGPGNYYNWLAERCEPAYRTNPDGTRQNGSGAPGVIIAEQETPWWARGVEQVNRTLGLPPRIEPPEYDKWVRYALIGVGALVAVQVLQLVKR